MGFGIPLYAIIQDPPESGIVLNNLKWLLPNTYSLGSFFASGCPNYVSDSVTMNGQPGVNYDVTLRILGVIEEKLYYGGAQHGRWNIGGTPAFDGANVYELQVSDPPQSYFINAGSSSYLTVFTVDMIRTFTVAAGATISLLAYAINSGQVQSRGTIMDGITDPTQPYNGQWAKLEFISSSVNMGSPPVLPDLIPILSGIQPYKFVYPISTPIPPNCHVADQWNASRIYEATVLGTGLSLASQVYLVNNSNTEVYNIGDSDCTLLSDSVIKIQLREHTSYTESAEYSVYVTSPEESNHITFKRWSPALGDGYDNCTLLCEAAYPVNIGYVVGNGFSSKGYWLCRADSGMSVVNALQDTNVSSPTQQTPVYGLGPETGYFGAYTLSYQGGLSIYKKSGGILSAGDLTSATEASLNDVFSTTEGTYTFSGYIQSSSGTIFSGPGFGSTSEPNFSVNVNSTYVYATIFIGGDFNDSLNYKTTPFVSFANNGPSSSEDFLFVVVRFKSGVSLDISVNGSSFSQNSISLDVSDYTGNSNPGVTTLTASTGSFIIAYSIICHSNYVSDDYAANVWQWARSRLYYI